MKTQNILFAIAIICSSFVKTNAQSTQKKVNEIGLFGEQKYYNSMNNAGKFGIFYRREIKENKFRRFQLFYTNFYSNIYSYKPYSIIQKNDTIISKRNFKNMKGFGIGYGIEKQRNFYKKVFLYAALDARFTYRKFDYFNYIDTSVLSTSQYTLMEHLNSTTTKIPNFTGNSFSVSILPTIGAKIDIKNRIVVGAEMMMTTSIGFQTQKENTTYTIFDFDMDLFTQKFYINYKF